MKILYVEDELAKSIPYIIRLFSKYLGQEGIQKLELLQTDENDGNSLSEEIKAIVEETDLVEVEYRFSGALDKIMNAYQKYALFIVDRNLVESEYYPEEIKEVDPDYTQIEYDDYFECEGDYLFCKLALAGRADIMKKFYYLTPHSYKQRDINIPEAVKALIDMNKFMANNFIEKNNEKGFKRLQKLVNNVKLLDVRNENRHYLKILKDNIDEESAQRFLLMLHNKDSNKKETVTDNLELLGNILKKILTEAAKRLNAPPSCWDNRNRLIIKNFLWRLTRDETDGRISYKFDTNSLLRGFLYTLYGITSDLSLREKSAAYQPTANTVNSLLYALKDIILWFGKICERWKVEGEKLKVKNY